MRYMEEYQTERRSFKRRIGTLCTMDFRRLRKSFSFYLFLAGCFVAPILIVVMTTMFGGVQTGEGQMAMEPFTHVWQVIESVRDTASEGGMDMMSMCNSNLIYVAATVFICLFVTEDFRSGYSKNLFSLVAHRADYVFAKTLIGWFGCAGMMLAYWLGAMVGGVAVGLSFHTGSAGVGGVVFCLLSKLLLLSVAVSIGVLMSVIGKQKVWLAMLGSLAAMMILYSMIPMIAPLDSGTFHVLLSLILGLSCGLGLGCISRWLLNRQNLV